MNSLETPYLTNSGFDDLSMTETILTLDFPIPCNVSAYFANIIIQSYNCISFALVTLGIP